MSERPQGITAEYLLSPEIYPVLGSVIDMRRGERVGTEILTKISSPTTSRVVVMGEPGNGKTTLLSEILGATRHLNAIIGTHSQIQTYTYDAFLAAEQRRIKIPFDEWTQNTWLTFNHRMHERLEKYASSTGTLQFVEIPGVGNTAERDRGVTCAQLLVQSSQESNGETLFLFMVRNRYIQDKAGKIRGAVKDIPNEQVEDFLKRNNIIIKGVEPGEKGGKEIKKYFKRMGKKVHIEAIRDEEMWKTNEWFDKNPQEAAERIAGIVTIPLVTAGDVSESLSKLTGYDPETYTDYSEKLVLNLIDEVSRNAAYSEHIFEDVLRVLAQNFYLLGNRFTNERIYIDFSQFGNSRKQAA